MLEALGSAMFLEFEKPIAELEAKIQELKHISDADDINIVSEIVRLKGKLDKLRQNIYNNLEAWQKVQVARHPLRPHFGDFIEHIFSDFIALAGDRRFAEDNALVGGFACLAGRKCMLIGHERGRNTTERVKHNFGMARPEGYRKAERLMRLAEKARLPIITLVDTPGAYPGICAEERGQAEAIARCIETCLDIRTPIVAVITGEGGSGGAVAIAIGDRLLMLEHAVYSVISPEGCASILWRTTEQSKAAAEALKLTAQNLQKINIIDEIIAEPAGGAQTNPVPVYKGLKQRLGTLLDELCRQDPEKLALMRREKYLAMGR